jgi:general secretion pathway protein D
VRVQSGRHARFTVGNETPILGAVTFQANGQAVQSVEYRPSGVIFDLQPQLREESIDVTVFQQMSSFSVTTTGVSNSPTLLKRELSTTLGMKAGETVLIGGLEDSRSSSDDSQLPFLPRWLGSRGSSNERTEVCARREAPVMIVLDGRRFRKTWVRPT